MMSGISSGPIMKKLLLSSLIMLLTAMVFALDEGKPVSQPERGEVEIEEKVYGYPLGITKDDILTILLEQEGRIKDLSFSFKMETVVRNKETLDIIERKWEKTSLSTKGKLFNTRRRYYENRKEAEGPVWDHQWSADGRIVYHLNKTSLFGRVMTKSPAEAPIKQNWGTPYNLACRRRPLRERGKRAHGANLIGNLEENFHIKLLDKMELFEGRRTVVIEIPESGLHYLDPEIGFAVVGYKSEERGILRVNSRFKEVMEGFWLPMYSEWRKDRDFDIVETKIEVTDLQVNQGLTTEDFKIKFPTEIKVYNEISGSSYISNPEGEMSIQTSQKKSSRYTITFVVVLIIFISVIIVIAKKYITS